MELSSSSPDDRMLDDSIGRNTYGNIAINDGARAVLGNVSNDVHVRGDLHLHINAQPQELSTVAVVHTFVLLASRLRRVGRAFKDRCKYADWDDVAVLRKVLKNIGECLMQLQSAGASVNIPASVSSAKVKLLSVPPMLYLLYTDAPRTDMCCAPRSPCDTCFATAARGKASRVSGSSPGP